MESPVDPREQAAQSPECAAADVSAGDALVDALRLHL
jgi:hypothetical protein